MHPNTHVNLIINHTRKKSQTPLAGRFTFINTHTDIFPLVKWKQSSGSLPFICKAGSPAMNSKTQRLTDKDKGSVFFVQTSFEFTRIFCKTEVLIQAKRNWMARSFLSSQGLNSVDGDGDFTRFKHS